MKLKFLLVRIELQVNHFFFHCINMSLILAIMHDIARRAVLLNQSMTIVYDVFDNQMKLSFRISDALV